MSTKAVEIFLSRPRIVLEEGDKLKPYDDATGLPVKAPVGFLSWGWGFNLMQCGSEGLFLVMARYLVGEIDRELSQYAWYMELDGEPTRQSVLLDIAYNGGVGGLLHYPRMLAAIHAKDWPTAAAECKVADARLNNSRYAPLRALLTAGDSHV